MVNSDELSQIRIEADELSQLKEKARLFDFISTNFKEITITLNGGREHSIYPDQNITTKINKYIYFNRYGDWPV